MDLDAIPCHRRITFLRDTLNGKTAFVDPTAVRLLFGVWMIFGLCVNRKKRCMAALGEKHGEAETSNFLVCFSTAY